MLRRYSAVMVTVLLTPLTASVGAQQSPAESGVFRVMRGRDTVAQERFSRTETELQGTLAFRDASHGVQVYKAVIGPDATMPLVEVTVREQSDSTATGASKAAADSAEGRIVQRARLIFRDDSVAVDALTDSGIQTHVLGTQRGAIPYLNLSFALLEQAVRRTRALRTPLADIPFFNLGGGQTAVGKIASTGADSVVVTLGDVDFRLHVDSVGRILGGRIPKQDVTVER